MQKLENIVKIDISKEFDKRLDTDFTILRIKNLENGKAFTGSDDLYTIEDITKICNSLDLEVAIHYIEEELNKKNLVEYYE